MDRMEDHLISYTQNDVKVEKREVLYKGVFCLARYHLQQRQFNGEWSKSYTREILERLSASAVLPYDPVRDQVILIEQFRAGALKDPHSPWLLEIVAGIFDKGESPQDVAA